MKARKLKTINGICPMLVNKIVPENYLMGGIHLCIEANFLTIFILSKTPGLSEINT
jgi:hypothetical protein